MMNNIDKIYCINLKHRPERKKLFTKRLKNTKVFPIENVKFIEAVDGNSLDSVPDPFNEGWPGNTKGAYGCLKSHVAAIKDASKNQYTRVLIFEDDVTFHKNFTDMFKKVSINIPAYWTTLFLGGNPISHIININPYIGKSKSYGAHAYLLHKCHYNSIIEWSENPTCAIDVFYAENLHNLPSSFLCSPRLCGQSPGHSDIEDREVDHSETMGGI